MLFQNLAVALNQLGWSPIYVLRAIGLGHLLYSKDGFSVSAGRSSGTGKASSDSISVTKWPQPCRGGSGRAWQPPGEWGLLGRDPWPMLCTSKCSV